MNVNKFWSENWKALALISTMVISGVGGYTNLLLEMGELRSEVKYLRIAHGECVESDGYKE